MNILVLNGSPKGDNSVTMQYVAYLQKSFPQHGFNIVNAAQEIRAIEGNPDRFGDVISAVRQADGVLWAFPLYVCLAHSNYLRFIELIGERQAGGAFTGKYAAALTTSIHYMDHIAHNYIRAVADDLGMRWAGSFSPAMNDLLEESGRRDLLAFAGEFFRRIELNRPTQRLFAPAPADVPEYRPGPATEPVDNSGVRVLLIASTLDESTNAGRMAARVRGAFREPPDVVDLSAARILGGCLGCIRCGFDNQCAYDGSDDIRDIYNRRLRQADVVILADALHGRFLSSRFKMFVDRRFLNTHQPQMEGKQVAYLVSGPLGYNGTAVEALQAVAELDRASLWGFVTDEDGDSAALDARLDTLAQELVERAREQRRFPATFLGVGGQKVFRDEVYGPLRFVFQGDHRYYRAHRMYDFPQKNLRARLQNAVMIPMSKIPQAKAYMQKEMVRLMLTEYKKINS